MGGLTTDRQNSWNPLVLSHTALPAPLLLSAKLLVLYWIINKDFLSLPEPFLPFIPVFDLIKSPYLYTQFLQCAFLIFAMMLFLNRVVRLCSFMAGFIIFLCILGARDYFSNSYFFFACFLMLIGLYNNEKSLWLLRAQIALVYFGAGLNKIFDADWLTGQYFEFWAREILRHSWYISLSDQFSPMLISKIICWLAIMVEGALAVLFTFPSLTSLAIALGILFHTGALVFTGAPDSAAFLYAMLCSYVAFIHRPEEPSQTQRLRHNPILYFALAALYLVVF